MLLSKKEQHMSISICIARYNCFILILLSGSVKRYNLTSTILKTIYLYFKINLAIVYRGWKVHLHTAIIGISYVNLVFLINDVLCLGYPQQKVCLGVKLAFCCVDESCGDCYQLHV